MVNAIRDDVVTDIINPKARRNGTSVINIFRPRDCRGTGTFHIPSVN